MGAMPPPPRSRLSQDRLVEKQLFRRLGIPTARIDDEVDGVPGAPEDAAARLRRKGPASGGDTAGDSPGHVLEERVAFDRELSLLAVRGRDGETRFWPLVENVHRRRDPADLARARRGRAAGGGRGATRARLLDELGYVGVLALELFDVGGRLLANEFAPRVHNTGHWTIEGAATSQFENHLRAILGLPLGSTDVAAVADGEPDRRRCRRAEACSAIPGAHLHLYGKEPRPGRKLGHVTLVEPTRAVARRLRSSTALRLVAAGRRGPSIWRPQEGQMRRRRLSSSACFFRPREEHRVADRHREGDEGHDVRVNASSGDVLCERRTSARVGCARKYNSRRRRSDTCV